MWNRRPGSARILSSVNPYRSGKPMVFATNGEKTTTEPSETTTGSTEKPEPLVSMINGKPPGNQSRSRRSGSRKSVPVPPKIPPVLFTEPRCRICRRPDIRARVNELIVGGFSIAAVLDMLTAINEGLPARSKITENCVAVHRRRHLGQQVPVAELLLAIQQQYQTELATQQTGIANRLTPAAFFATVMVKAAGQLPDFEISLGDGLMAARELSKLLASDDDNDRWARQQAEMGRIVEAMRALPGEAQAIVLAKLDGRPWPPEPTPGRVYAIEGGQVTGDRAESFIGRNDTDEDEYDQPPFGDDDDYDDDDD